MIATEQFFHAFLKNYSDCSLCVAVSTVRRVELKFRHRDEKILERQKVKKTCFEKLILGIGFICLAG